jgi:hypothetical protein
MARPIADTPILRGEDARRFDEAMKNLKPVSAEERERIERNYPWCKAHATFYRP